MPRTVETLWDQLTPEQQALVTQLMAALAGQPAPSAPAPTDPGAFLLAWEAEDSALTAEEAAAAAAEWQTIAAGLDAHRLSNRPLFP